MHGAYSLIVSAFLLAKPLLIVLTSSSPPWPIQNRARQILHEIRRLLPLNSRRQQDRISRKLRSFDVANWKRPFEYVERSIEGFETPFAAFVRFLEVDLRGIAANEGVKAVLADIALGLSVDMTKAPLQACVDMCVLINESPRVQKGLGENAHEIADLLLELAELYRIHPQGKGFVEKELPMVQREAIAHVWWSWYLNTTEAAMI